MAGPFDACSGSVYAALLWITQGLRRGHLDGAPDWWVETLRFLLDGIPGIDEHPKVDEAGAVGAAP